MLAGMAIAPCAWAQGIDVDQPTRDAGATFEVVGPNAVVDITVTKAEGTPAAIGNAVALTASYQYQIAATTSAGGVTVLQAFAAIPDAAIDSNKDGTYGDAGATGAGATFTSRIHFGRIAGLTTLLNTFQAQVDADPALISLVVQLRVNAGANSATTEITQTGAGVLTAAGEALEVLNTPIAISNAYVSTSGGNTVLNLVFNRSLDNTVAANDNPEAGGTTGNQTSVVGNLVLTDFQLAADATFGTPLALTGTLVPAPAFVVGSNGTTVQIAITPPTNVAAGQFVRVNDGDAVDGDANDAVGNFDGILADVIGNFAELDTNGVQITALPTFTITSANFIQQITADAAVANAVRVTFSLPVNTGDLGDFGAGTTFFGQFLRKADGTASDLEITGAAIDPNDPNSVLLTIDRTDADPDDAVFADGLSLDGAGYRLDTTATGANVPSSIFATNDYATAQQLALGDDIAPVLVGYGFLDRDRDGRIDAFGAIFNEPGTSTVTQANVTFRKINATVQPIGQIRSDGTLVNDMVVADAAPANNVIPYVTTGTVQEVSSVNDNNVNTPARLSVNNAVVWNIQEEFNWDNIPATTGDAEAIPGTGGGVGGTPFATIESTTGVPFTDVNGNLLSASALTATNVTLDFAAPVVLPRFHTGDNTNNDFLPAGPAFTGGPSDGDAIAIDDVNSLLNEQSDDGDSTSYETRDLGDAIYNNLIVFVGSENFAGGGVTNQGQVRFGSGGATGFAAADEAFTTNNITAFVNRTANAAVVAGVPVSIGAGSGLADAAGNETTLAETATVNITGPYVALQPSAANGQPIFSGFLVSTDADPFAEEIILTFNRALDPATVTAADFAISPGTLGTVTASGSTVTLGLTGDTVSTTSTVQVTFNGSTQVIGSASGGPTTSSVAPNAGAFINVFNVGGIPNPTFPTQAMAIMDITGRALRGGTGLARGTQISALIAVPHIHRISGTRDNVPFVLDAVGVNDSLSGGADLASLNAANNVFFGLRRTLYGGHAGGNTIAFRTEQDDGTFVTGDVVAMNINFNNLTNVTFTGNGEASNFTQTPGDRFTNGTFDFCWDVIRASGGRIENLFANGPVWGGVPIASTAVITSNDGSYELHVSLPFGIFDGLNRLAGVDPIVIIVAQEPDGTRTVVSSVLASAIAADSALTDANGAPIVFRAQNRTQQSSGEASDAFSFDFDVADVGRESIFQGWNAIGNQRKFGFSTSASSNPLLPTGVVAADVRTFGAGGVPAASRMPFAGPFEQFALFRDTNSDGFWTIADGTDLSGIVVDVSCLRHFIWTLTSRGLSVGSGVSSIVGGYGIGFFNNSGTAGGGSTFGMFQFGTALDSGEFFPSAFPNNATTQGWAFVTAKQAFATPAAVADIDGNGEVDYIISFRNNGPNAAAAGRQTTEVSSFDLSAESPEEDPQDTGAISDGQAIFVHFGR
ncbi:MAG: hypothetical protein SFZ24_07430 [Planctomycetota bacterium]|nr:hypothetical protein [Planctomycetota bacterium]